MDDPLSGFGRTAHGLSRNPLGIIALFIVLVYGIAALVLSTSASHLQPAERTPLVWFLVSFPFIVLGVFGWLVSRHHTKLYAPFDFQSDTSFLQTIGPDAQRARLEIEMRQLEEAEAEADGPANQTPPRRVQLPQSGLPSASPPPPAERECLSATSGSEPGDARSERAPEISRRAESRASVLLAQELVLRRLESELGQPIARQAALTDDHGRSFFFDGIAVASKWQTTAVEVKVLRKASAMKAFRRVLADVLFTAQAFHRRFPAGAFIFALVSEGITPDELASIRARVSAEVAERGSSIDVRFYDLEELKMEFGVLTSAQP